jgi:hypothetical protein
VKQGRPSQGQVALCQSDRFDGVIPELELMIRAVFVVANMNSKLGDHEVHKMRPGEKV